MEIVCVRRYRAGVGGPRSGPERIPRPAQRYRARPRGFVCELSRRVVRESAVAAAAPHGQPFDLPSRTDHDNAAPTRTRGCYYRPGAVLPLTPGGVEADGMNGYNVVYE